MDVVLHTHLDGVRTINRTTATWQEDAVMITTVMQLRSIGISSFFWPEREEPFASLHVAGTIGPDGQRETFSRFHDWRDLDRAQRLRTCVHAHAHVLVQVLAEMGMKAEFETDATTMQRFELAVLSQER